MDYPSSSQGIAFRTSFRAKRFDLIMVIWELKTNRALALGERRFCLTDSTVEHYWLQVVSGNQGQRIGTRVIAALLPLYLKWGITTVKITAGLSAGGSVWARFGFSPDLSEWLVLRKQIRRNILQLAQSPALPEPISRALTDALMLLESDNPRHLWAISDMAERYNGARLGSALLRRTRWKGTLDFRDVNAVIRLRDEFKRNQLSFKALDELATAARDVAA